MCTKDAILCVDPDKTADYKKCVETTGGGTHWSETTEKCTAAFLKEFDERERFDSSYHSK